MRKRGLSEQNVWQNQSKFYRRNFLWKRDLFTLISDVSKKFTKTKTEFIELFSIATSELLVVEIL